MNSSFSFKSSWCNSSHYSKSSQAKQLARQGIESFLSPKQKWRQFSFLLSLSFFYGVFRRPSHPSTRPRPWSRNSLRKGGNTVQLLALGSAPTYSIWVRFPQTPRPHVVFPYACKVWIFSPSKFYNGHCIWFSKYTKLSNWAVIVLLILQSSANIITKGKVIKICPMSIRSPVSLPP